MKYIIYSSEDGFRWHLKGRNGEVMCQGEPHPTLKLAKAAVKRVKRSLFAEVIVRI